ncbi:MAG: hypothetical protein M3Q10_15580 [Chloroflexota bacterium]|nr:hypothetical protein [Chloroflexota bacterium]
MTETSNVLEPVEVETVDDLKRLIEQVRTTDTALVVSVDGDQAVLTPPPPGATEHSREEQRRADDDTFLSAFGSWKGLIADPEEFKQQIKVARGSNRPYREITLPDE